MTEGENMLERCARALHAQLDAKSKPAFRVRWEDAVPSYRDCIRAEASAVIEALMEPTPEMIEAAGNAEIDPAFPILNWRDLVRCEFQAMLRTALSKPNEEGEGK